MTENSVDKPVPVTATTIGAWLLSRIETASPQYVYQSQVVNEIRNTFGVEWSYLNKNGNWAISKEVLKEFGKLKYPTIYWERGSQAWHVITNEQLHRIEEQAALRKRRREDIANQAGRVGR